MRSKFLLNSIFILALTSLPSALSAEMGLDTPTPAQVSTANTCLTASLQTVTPSPTASKTASSSPSPSPTSQAASCGTPDRNGQLVAQAAFHIALTDNTPDAWDSSAQGWDPYPLVLPSATDAATLATKYPSLAPYVGLASQIVGTLEIDSEDVGKRSFYRIVTDNEDQVVVAAFGIQPPATGDGQTYQFSGRHILKPGYAPNEYEPTASKSVFYVTSFTPTGAPMARLARDMANGLENELSAVNVAPNNILVVPIGFDAPNSTTQDLAWSDSFATESGRINSRAEFTTLLGRVSSEISRISHTQFVPNFTLDDPALADMNIFRSGCRNSTIRKYSKRELSDEERASYNHVIYVFASPASAIAATEGTDACPTESKGFVEVRRGKSSAVISNYRVTLSNLVHLVLHQLGAQHTGLLYCGTTSLGHPAFGGIPFTTYFEIPASGRTCGSAGGADVFDVMGAGDSSSGLSPIEQLDLGWLPPIGQGNNGADILEVRTSGEYKLANIDDSLASPHPHVLAIPLSRSGSSSKYYYLTFQEGKLLTRINVKGGGGTSQLVNTGAPSTPGTSSALTLLQSSAGASLLASFPARPYILPGHQYLESVRNYQIIFQGVENNVATVRIQFHSSVSPVAAYSSSNVQGRADSRNSITLTWTPVSGASSYHISRARFPDAVYNGVTYPNPVGTDGKDFEVSGTTTTLTDTNLQPNSFYGYVVQVRNAQGALSSLNQYGATPVYRTQN